MMTGECAKPYSTAQTGESFFHPFQSNGERETEKRQGPNPQSTQAPFMGVLGETFICPFLSWRKRVSSSARSELQRLAETRVF